MLNGKINIYSEIKTSEVQSEIDSFFLSLDSMQVKKAPAINNADAVLFELNEDYEKDLTRIQELIESKDSPRVMVLSGKMDTEIILRAMRVGVSDFFPLPLEKDRLKQTLKKIQSQKSEDAGNEARIINVVGSKGGVGTTTLAVNLAVALAYNKPSNSVLIMDMNILYGEVPLLLDVETKQDWGEIAWNIERVDATYLLNAVSRHSSGLYVLPSPGRLNHQPAGLDKILGNLFSLLRRMFTYIIIDSGQRLDPLAVQTMHLADMVLITTILNLPCLNNTNKLLMNLGEMGFNDTENFRIVVNRYLRNSSITLEEAEKTISKEIFWTIPNDFSSSMSSINAGKPLIQMNPGSQVSKRIQALAEAISETQEAKDHKKPGSWQTSYRSLTGPIRRFLSR